MPKIEHGRIAGLYEMSSYTADELYAWADRLEVQSKNPQCPDDPRWLKRWAERIRRLARKKEKSLRHKRQQK
jgi:hypothetical protein